MKLISSGGPSAQGIPEDISPKQELQLERLLQLKQKKKRKLEAESQEEEQDEESAEKMDEKQLIRKMLARMERPSKKDA